MSIQLTTHELNELFPGQMIENSDPFENDRVRKNHFEYCLDFDGVDEEFCCDEYCGDYQTQALDTFQHPLRAGIRLSPVEIPNFNKDFLDKLQLQAYQEEWGEVAEEPEAFYEQSKRVEVIDPIVVSPIRMIYKGKFNEKRGYRRNRVKILVA
ncbi:hypothetical protein CL684_00720 [Candidatus Campbellbacteria bacterium]|nr:hypothetical protein [Candidatus Campbellbacteria bacterium]|tara:strand:- start:611 stop:1069 length:459 start_codon:yes stop_codon:yes gene_type:complete